MEKEIYMKIVNVLTAEGKYILKNEKDIDVKTEKMNTIFNLKMIMDNYDELQPVLKDYFEKKSKERKWTR